jgi:UDP-glucose 4-epimerase
MAEVIEESELIYHLAAAVGVKYIMENRFSSLQTNVRGIEIVLELASKDKKKVMLASSSEVYGKNGTVPFNEESDSVLGPTTLHRWSYACTKMVDEFWALVYFKEKQLPIVIMRFFNTVGQKQLGRYGMVVPRFIKRALSGAPLQVYGDGTQTRCFTYISDVIRAMVELATCSDAVGEVFNIGSEEEISIKDLAKKIIKLTGSSSDLEYISYEKAYGEGFEDMKRRVPDISKIKRVIGWQPKTGLDELLNKMIAYERENSLTVSTVRDKERVMNDE